MSDKYLLFANNEIRFDATKYGEKSIVREASTSWLNILSKNTRSIAMKVTKTLTDLQDLYIDLDELTEYQNDSLITYEMVNSREYEGDPNDLVIITLEMNLDKIYIKRLSYGFLDVLSDIGGIAQAFTAAATLILSIFNYQNIEKFLASKLFKL